MNTSISLYRKRHIPEEYFLLDKDEILYLDDSILISRWNAIKPREDFASGISVYDFKNNWKITRVACPDGSLYHWYCDIIKMEIHPDTATYICEDLLVDVIVKKDNTIMVLDLDEAADAFDQGMISGADLSLALRSTNNLLNEIQYGDFARYQNMIQKYV